MDSNKIKQFLMHPIFLGLLVLFSAYSVWTVTSGSIDPKTGQKMLLGPISLDDLKEDPFEEWYASGFQDYDVDYQLISAIEDPNVYTYEVFLGTWCEDSRKEVPRIAKIFKTLGVPEENVIYICVDRDKVSPGNEQEGKDIRYVPTLIVNQGNEEIGRIVESPIGTLESDLLEIDLGIPPVPNYAQ